MKLGFIGCGNMAKAMLGGILKNEICAKEDVIATAKSEASRENARNTYGIQVTADNIEAAKSADVLVLAVKPIFYEEVIHEIKDAVDEKKIIISIAPGKTLAWLEEQFGKKVKLVRCMPNTPALVGEGMTGVCCNEEVSDAEMQDVLKILESCGKAEMLPERLIDVVVSVSGSSPAYVFMFIEAMADAAVADGMRVHRHIVSQHRQSLAVQRWCWRQANIPVNLKTWYAHRAAQRLRQCVFWKKRVCEVL